jgi:hypothetical protein
MMQLFFADLASLNDAVQRWVERLVDRIFAFTQRGGRRRWAAFLSISLLLWITIALLAHPLGQSNTPLMSQLFTALFAKDVLRHFLVLGLALWLALRLAAIYLDDIFELDDTSVADRFLRQAAFASRFPVIRIREGGVDPVQRNSPITRIGGPGLVDVHLENAALFEKPDGSPHVVRPTLKKAVVLDGFERLRKVIDLRDQVLEVTVNGRTQDGIPVTAKDVRLVFSVYRGAGQFIPGADMQQSYPFDEEAVHALVYRQGSAPWIEAMRGLVRSELSSFITRHTLNEFLVYAEDQPDPDRFISRDEISGLFYDFTQGFSKRAQENGIQLTWIGLGTWVTPSEIIPEQHLEAWRLSSDNRLRGSEWNLRRIRNESRLSELMRLIDQISSSYYEWIGQDLPPETILRRMILQYREKLRLARSLYEEHNQPVPPELDAAIRHLTLLAAIRLAQSAEGTE